MTWPKPSFNKKFYNCSKLWILSIVQEGYSQIVLSSYGMLKAFKLVQNLIYIFFSSPKVVFSLKKTKRKNRSDISEPKWNLNIS